MPLLIQIDAHLKPMSRAGSFGRKRDNRFRAHVFLSLRLKGSKAKSAMHLPYRASFPVLPLAGLNHG
jgi:hypothetical protein